MRALAGFRGPRMAPPIPVSVTRHSKKCRGCSYDQVGAPRLRKAGNRAGHPAGSKRFPVLRRLSPLAEGRPLPGQELETRADGGSAGCANRETRPRGRLYRRLALRPGVGSFRCILLLPSGAESTLPGAGCALDQLRRKCLWTLAPSRFSYLELLRSLVSPP